MRTAPQRPLLILATLLTIAFVLAGAQALPVSSRDQRVALYDVIDHIRWVAPKGVIMAPCYEFRRTPQDGWLVRCGDRSFLYDPESGEVEPADELTREAWRQAWAR